MNQPCKECPWVKDHSFGFGGPRTVRYFLRMTHEGDSHVCHMGRSVKCAGQRMFRLIAENKLRDSTIWDERMLIETAYRMKREGRIKPETFSVG